MNSNPLETMDENSNGFAIISNTEAELFDKVMMSAENEADFNYLNLIAECISEISQAEPNEKNCSVEVISETCEVHKYYKQTADATIENHFTHSLSTEQLKMSTDVNEKEIRVKKTGASKRKAKRKPTVTSLMPNRAQTTKHARVEPTMVQAMTPVQPRRPAEPMRPTVAQPYTLMHPACGQQPSPAARVDGGPYYMTSLPQYCLPYQRYGNNGENMNDSKQPVYTSFYKGSTLVEIYSPSVGRGFNPRYNSMLIEPTIQPFLPHITGLSTTISEAMADLHTFHQMAVEFRVPGS